MDLLIRDASGR